MLGRRRGPENQKDRWVHFRSASIGGAGIGADRGRAGPQEAAGTGKVDGPEGLPAPSSPIVTLLRTAQARPPPHAGRSSRSRRRRSPRPSAPPPSPGPCLPPPPPPPLLHVGSEQIRLHVSLRGTCRDPGSGPLPPPGPSDLRVQLPALTPSGAGSLGRSVSRTSAVGHPSSLHPLSLTPLCLGGVSLGARLFCAAGASVRRGPREEEQRGSPKPSTYLTP